MCVRHLPAERLAPGCTIERQAGRQCDALGSVLLRSLPCGCYFDTTTYLSCVADHEKRSWKHSLMAVGLFQQDNVLCQG